MGRALLKTVRNAIQKRGMLRAGERVGVAVSSGADSVALLLLMIELRKQLGVLLSVVHFNHQLRGKYSEGDEKFAAGLAAKYKLGFHVGRGDIGTEARRQRANLEDTGRRARYEFFERLTKEGVVDKVAVAHTADDQAETVLAHILRGTGLAGLGGIHPRVGHVVRPLLGVRRGELRAYLKSKKQSWREDASNRDTTRMRARIRKKLLPILEKQFQGAVVEHLGTLAELAREDEAFLEGLVDGGLGRLVERGTAGVRIPVSELLGTETETEFNTEGSESAEAERRETRNLSAARRMVRRIIREFKPRAGQLNAEHVGSILDLAQRGENGKSLQLPGGLLVLREHDWLVFCMASERFDVERRKPLEFERAVKLEGSETLVPVPELSCVFRFRVIDWPAKRRDTIETGFVLDGGALQSPLELRNWRPGDRFRPYGHRSEHKLKRLLSKKGVSGREREGWPVVTSRGALVWTRGFPVAAEFAAKVETRFGVVITEEPIS